MSKGWFNHFLSVKQGLNNLESQYTSGLKKAFAVTNVNG